jgi:hypothetical protein
MDNTLQTKPAMTLISFDDAAKVCGGMIKLPGGPTVPTAGKSDTGWTWGTVSDLPASEGIGIVIHF